MENKKTKGQELYEKAMEAGKNQINLEGLTLNEARELDDGQIRTLVEVLKRMPEVTELYMTAHFFPKHPYSQYTPIEFNVSDPQQRIPDNFNRYGDMHYRIWASAPQRKDPKREWFDWGENKEIAIAEGTGIKEGIEVIKNRDGHYKHEIVFPKIEGEGENGKGYWESFTKRIYVCKVK